MKQRGMTLLEVMVALALLATVGLALMKTSSEQVGNLTRLEQKQFALWVADNQLAQLQLQNQWPDLNWHHGSTVMADREWYWRWRGVSTSDSRLRALEIEVRLARTESSALATLNSWQVKP